MPFLVEQEAAAATGALAMPNARESSSLALKLSAQSAMS